MRHQTIADAIERYLQRHPAAADSEVGIAEWWLLEAGIRASVDDVRRALKLLEERGVMENVTLQDGRRLWRPTTGRPGRVGDCDDQHNG
jgi:Fe2+ or Zn2+ uptake regulation protein